MYTYKEPLIFVLSGKAKSGKNLIADKIENYYKNKKPGHKVNGVWQCIECPKLIKPKNK